MSALCRRERRAFTILEVVLAASIGTMVVLTAASLFAVINTSQAEALAHYQQTLELTQTHEAMQRAMRLIVTTDAPAPVSPPGDDRAAAQPDSPPAEVETPDPTVENPSALLTAEAERARPRFLLEPDRRYRAALATAEGFIQPQRLELSLRAVPIFVTPIAGLAEEIEDEQARQEFLSGVGSRLVPGVRGVFELEYDAGRDASAAGPARAAGWTLWWRQLLPSPGALGADLDLLDPELESLRRGQFDDDELRPGAVRLATGLASCQWEAYKGTRYLHELRGMWSEDLPAFVKAKITTIDGRVYDWMFEIGWTLGEEPGTVVVERPAPGDAAAGEETEGVSAAEEFLRNLESQGLREGEMAPESPGDDESEERERPAPPGRESDR